MRWTADADLPAFHKVDARCARFDAHVTAAAQNGFHLSIESFGAHGSGDGDGFAVDGSYGVGGGLVWARRGEVSRAETESCPDESKNPRASNQMEEGSHCVILPVTSAETLTYTIRVPPPGRT